MSHRVDTRPPHGWLFDYLIIRSFDFLTLWLWNIIVLFPAAPFSHSCTRTFSKRPGSQTIIKKNKLVKPHEAVSLVSFQSLIDRSSFADTSRARRMMPFDAAVAGPAVTMKAVWPGTFRPSASADMEPIKLMRLCRWVPRQYAPLAELTALAVSLGLRFSDRRWREAAVPLCSFIWRWVVTGGQMLANRSHSGPKMWNRTDSRQLVRRDSLGGHRSAPLPSEMQHLAALIDGRWISRRCRRNLLGSVWRPSISQSTDHHVKASCRSLPNGSPW